MALLGQRKTFIEKRTWKRYIKARKKLIKDAKKNKPKKIQRQKAIKNLEQRLTIQVKGVGEVKLYEEKFDAAVSFIAAEWHNTGKNKETIKELLVLDPRSEFEKNSVNKYEVKKFKTENQLIKYFIEANKKRKPVFSSGHNQVYDVTQTRFAADENKELFSPGIEKIKPRRDFVRYFYQRMREDLIYIDSMRIAANMHTYLMQKSLGTSLKLADVANFFGTEFKKSLTHEQLRTVEIQRLFGKTKEIRKKATKQISDYAAGDVKPVIDIVQKSKQLSLIEKLKYVLPFCTYTEISFLL